MQRINTVLIRLFRLIKIISLTTFLLVPLYGQNPNQSVIDVNNITSWVSSNGFHPAIVTLGDVGGGDWNGTFPKRTAGAIYTEGIVWGGLVQDGLNPVVRVSGSGWLNGNMALTRLFRVRPYYDKIDLRDDASSTFRVLLDQVTDSMVVDVYNQYKKDWAEWPADKGAPFNDINKDRIYEPSIDIPGIPGASQTIWISYDDSRSADIYGSPPIGLDVQETYWAYNDDSTQNDVIYKNVKIIYKGLTTSKPDSRIDSMYITEFSDVDIGWYVYNFVGCDTLLNLGYGYKPTYSDPYYSKYSLAPPAVGHTFLQGVAHKTGVLTDSAIVNFKWRKGYKFFNSKPLTRFIPFRTTSYVNSYIPRYNYIGTLQYYTLMSGYINRYGYLYPVKIDPPITYMVTGDPVTKTGWIDGDEPAGARSMNLVTGPFYLNLGDTAEVTMALVGGIGIDNISSITNLRYNTRYAIASYNYFVQQMTEGAALFAPPPPPSQPRVLPEHYLLSQNYPNPFNPTTTIKYELPKAAYVRLVVYDILGREVKVLVDEQKEAGNYTVKFDGSDLPSGVYFYRITFTNSDSKLVNDNLSKVNKLMLIK